MYAYSTPASYLRWPYSSRMSSLQLRSARNWRSYQAWSDGSTTLRVEKQVPTIRWKFSASWLQGLVCHE